MVEDMISHQSRGFKWHYSYPDDMTRGRMQARPLQPWRALPEPGRRSDDEDDHEQRSRRHMSRSLWDRLSGRVASRSRELDCDDCIRYIATTRRTEGAKGPARQVVETGDSRSRSHHLSRSVEPGETRIRRHSVVEQHRSILPQSPANQNNAQDSRALLDLLEKHLDPMHHEASSIGRSTYSPDTSLPPPASPMFVLSSVAGQDEQAALPGWTQQVVGAFLAEITTPPPSSSRSSQHWGLNSATPAATRYW